MPAQVVQKVLQRVKLRVGEHRPRECSARMLRGHNGLTQQDLAHQLEFNQPYVYKLETGKRKPSAELVLKIAHLFGVTPDQLLLDELDLQE